MDGTASKLVATPALARADPLDRSHLGTGRLSTSFASPSRYGVGMVTIEQVAERTGQSVTQARRLIDALDGVLRSHIHRGARNAILLDQAGLALVERAAELKASGVVLADLADTVAQEMNGNHEDPSSNGHETEHNGPVKLRESDCEGCAQRDRLIEYLEDEIKELRADKERLRRERDEFRQLALPAPRRGPLAWLGNLFSRNGAA